MLVSSLLIERSLAGAKEHPPKGMKPTQLRWRMFPRRRITWIGHSTVLVEAPPAFDAHRPCASAALFLAEGVLEVIMALRVRPHEGWVWLLLSGLVAAAVGIMIAMGLPSSATWAIGLLTGINLLMTGASFIALALAGRRGDVPAVAAA